MGCGIALACAAANTRVRLIKATPGTVDHAKANIQKAYDRRIAKGKISSAEAKAILDRIQVSSDLSDLKDCSIVIESIIENADAKRALFHKLAGILEPDALIATNTSTLKLQDICPKELAERFVGLHFFSPAQKMTLVEVASTLHTSQANKERAESFVSSINKTPIPVDDSTGFIVNRLLVPFLTHAISAYEKGLGTVEHIDQAMKLGCGHPVGPLALCDLVGLDIVLSMAKLLHADFKDSCYAPPQLLKKMVVEGRLGKKSGLGFYDYSSKPATPTSLS